MQSGFHRSTKDRRFGGVCAGLAETFGLDITLVRIAAFLLCVMYPSAVILYFVLALTMPILSAQEEEESVPRELPKVIGSISPWRAAAVCAGCTLAGHLIYRFLFKLPSGFHELTCFALLAIGLYVMTDGLLCEPSDSDRIAKISLGAICAFLCLRSLSSAAPAGFGAVSFGYVTAAFSYLWPALIGLAALSLIMPKKKIATALLWAAVIAVMILSVIRALSSVL